MINEKIIVNATALDKSGGLSILKQFVDSIPDNGYKWLIFIPENITIANPNTNIRLEKISGVKPLHKRLWWDAFGLKKWLKNNSITSLASISLQNTGFSVGKSVPSFIYYHQSIPFYPYNWNPFKKQDRPLWFYKNIYPFFVKLFLKKDTKVFVQLDFIKEGFANRFNHPKESIEVFSPGVISPSFSKCDKKDVEKLKFFYPATGFFYKNHRIIIDALKQTDIDADFYFTAHKSEIGAKDARIKMMGPIPYTKVCDMYNDCDALLFPSYIETYGLPLLEAAMTGMPIIAADLPYAREVLDGYEGVIYAKHDDPLAWAEAMQKIKKGKRYNPIDISTRKGWPDLFKSILSNIS